MLTIVLSGILLFQLQSNTIDVCSASEITDSRVLRVRGTGGTSGRDGAMLFDYTCPAATENDFILPTVVFLEQPKFSSAQIAKAFETLSEKSVFQSVIEGRLECRAPFTVKKADDGDIVAANGFGPSGMYRCRIRGGMFISLQVLETE